MELLEKAKKAAAEKAAELTAKLGVRINPIVFVNPDSEADEVIVGFFREPNRAAKMMIMDKAMVGGFSAASAVYEAVIVKEESDPRLYSEAPEHDALVMGGIQAVYSRVQLAVDQFKKK